MTPDQWIALVGVVGGSAVLREAIAGLRAWKSGRAKEEQAKNRSELQRLRAVQAERDKVEADFSKYRAKAESKIQEWRDYSGDLRWRLQSCGYPVDAIHPPE